MNHQDACHHCGSPLAGSAFAVVLQGEWDDHRLSLCERCQALRQAGQLPVDLLVQQWTFARSGSRALGEAETLLVQLDCLGCGSRVARVDDVGAVPAANRMPDGSLSTECPNCRRTNVLERRGSQLVAVRLW